ncbi:hypothetical protein BJX76DRAFT_325184 [Aspergillus varians]
MLRCSNATAFRTQFTTTMALRAPLTAPWIRASQSLLLPYAHSAAAGRIATISRSFYKDSSGPRGEDGATGVPQFKPTPRPGARQARPGFSHDDRLMEIALDKGPRVPHKTIETELAWLKDRTILLERIQRLLRRDDIVMAAALVRAATRAQYDCTAAWNCILDYCLEKGNAKAAFKFWNDMKKRGSMPNDWSYTTMLHGLSKVKKTPYVDPVVMARSVYRSLLNPNSSVKLALIHTNAMLSVCGHHGAMDVLWEVAGGIPEEGPESPDSYTYTIILNAIRRSIQRDVEKFKEYEAEKSHHKRLAGIAEGKRVWSDIIYRWKSGHIAMSNQLVTAMAGLLWEGIGDRHLYEVLQLLHQTTGLPILAKEPSRDFPSVSRRAYSRLNTPLENAETAKPGKPAETEEDVVPFVDERGKEFNATESSPGPEQFETLEKEDENFDQLFDPVVAVDKVPYTGENLGITDGPNYMPIGNRELSILLETCLQMTYAVQAAKSYWQHLTQEEHEYRIIPDRRAFLGYLRILRVAHSSRLMVEVIRDQMLPAGIDQGLPFHIALSACRRDRKNPNVLKNANELLKMMDHAVLIPDYRALGGYIDLVNILQDNPQHLVSLNGLNVDTQSLSSKLETLGRALVLDLQKVAVENLRPLIAKLDEAMTEAMDGHPDLTGRNGVEPKAIKLQSQPGAQALTVLTRMRMLIDSILKREYESLLSKEERKKFEEESVALRKYSKVDVINRYKTKTIFATAKQQTDYHNRRKAELAAAE